MGCPTLSDQSDYRGVIPPCVILSCFIYRDTWKPQVELHRHVYFDRIFTHELQSDNDFYYFQLERVIGP